MPAPNLGPDYALAVRLSAIEDQLRRLQQNPLGQAFSATQSDGSVGMRIYQDPATGSTAMVFLQGTTTPRDPNNAQHPELMYVGEVHNGAGFQDSAVLFTRPNGVQSGEIGRSGLQVRDAHSNVTFSTDEYAAGAGGVGLNSPWIPLGTPVSATPSNAGWPGTSASSLTEVSLLAFPAQHAKLTWYGYAWCPTGAAGQVQVQVNNGAAGAVHTVGAGFTGPIVETISFTAGSWGWQQVLTLTGNAALTSGTGPIQFVMFGVWGSGSGF